MENYELNKKIHKINISLSLILKLLKETNLVKTTNNNFLQEDKEDFLLIWENLIFEIKEIQKLISKYRVRKYIFFINKNNLLIKKYLLTIYFNILVDLIKIFGKNEDFIRIFLDENSKNDYGKIAKYIYRPSFISILNFPIVFLEIDKKNFDKNLYYMFNIKQEKLGKGKRILTDYKNIYYYIKYRYQKILFYISKILGFFISKTRFSLRTKGLISNKNIKKFLNIANPGDILLTRGNWNASNISIPGFWKHMSMYIGTGRYLKTNFGINYNFLLKLDDDTHYIIEATGKGVNILNIYNLLTHNDYLGVIRTKFSDNKIKRSIKNTLSYYGQPYDFVFNYYSNNNVVCSELITKAYLKEHKKDEGFIVKLEKIGPNLTYPPNKFIFDAFNEKEILKPIFFIDSIEKTQKNFISSIEELKKSAKRSRFSFFLK